jgi:AcrR family transcriptional regulator
MLLEAVMAKSVQTRDFEGTRQALLLTALDLFGRRGFEATSTREIAHRAGVNSAGIAYHFGGKDGLRQACAALIIERLQATVLGATGGEPDPLTRQQALELLLQIADRVVLFATRGAESESIARFVMREMMEPTTAFETLYSGLFEPVHGRLCVIWAAASGGDPLAAETKLRVFAMLGQIFYFRLARPAIMRRMAWQELGLDEARAVSATIRASIRASTSMGELP